MATKLPIEEIAKAVSWAVSSVLAKMETNNNSDDDDFQLDKKSKSIKRRTKVVGGGLGIRGAGPSTGPKGKARKANFKARKLPYKWFFPRGAIFANFVF